MWASNNQRGFTLLEILIAITILAFISLGVVNITENAALTMERTTEVNENNLQIETAMNRFEWDFIQIYSPLFFSKVMNMNTLQQPGTQGGVETDAQGANQSREQGGEDSESQGVPKNNIYLQQYYEQLVQRFERNEHFRAVSQEGLPIPRYYAPEKNVFEFFTTSNRRKVENQRQSHFAWVRYSLAPQEATPEEDENPNIPKNLKSFVRYFSADDPYSDKRLAVDNGAGEVKAAVLLRNVENLEFQFWDFQRRKWESSLRSIQDGESLVRGVKVLLTWYDNFGHKRTTSRIFRTHWPMVVPQDQPAATTVTPGVNPGGNPGGGNPDSDENFDEE